MRVLLIILALFVMPVRAQTPAPASPAPVLLIFDSSGSMSRAAGSETRIEAARRVVVDFLGQFPDGAPLGVTLYGHRRARDCSDIENVAPIAPATRAGLIQLATRIGGLQARGETPIARTLTQSIPLFGGRPGRIVLVTDGREECGGDVCAAARQLSAAGVSLRVDIVGFGTGPAERQALQCITEITGGQYLEARDAATLAAALQATRVAPPRTRLRVTVTENGRVPAAFPAVRVQGANNFDMSLSDRTTVFDLPPGTYRVSARIGSGRPSDPVTVEVPEGRTTELALALGTGRLIVNIQMGGGRPFPVHPNVELRRGSEVVNATSGQIASFDANAGDYGLRVVFPGGQQFVDIPGLTIRAGATENRVIEAPAGRVSFAFAGRFATPGVVPCVEIRQGGRVIIGLGNNPATFVLAPGEYEMVAGVCGGPEVARQNFAVAAGDNRTVSLDP